MFRIGGLQAHWVGVFGLVAVGCTAPDQPGDWPSEAQLQRANATGGYDEIIDIDNSADLVANIGNERTLLRLRTTSTDPGGVYTLTQQADLGWGSAVIGALELEVIDGEPTGRVITPGPHIDCDENNMTDSRWEKDDNHNWRKGCFTATDGMFAGFSLDNGDTAVAGAKEHRNGIRVDAPGTVVVERMLATDVRRGWFQVAASGMSTKLVVTDSAVIGTELAGEFTILGKAPFGAVYDAEAKVEVTSTWMERIGFHPMLMLWAAGGGGNTLIGTLEDNVVVDSLFGVSVLGEAGYGVCWKDPHVASVPDPVTDNDVDIIVRGGRQEGSVAGLLILQQDFCSVGTYDGNNRIDVDVQGVDFVGNGSPVLASKSSDRTDSYTLSMRDNAYIGAAEGPVDVFVFTPDELELTGSADDFTRTNDNFDISGALDFFAEP